MSLLHRPSNYTLNSLLCAFYVNWPLKLCFFPRRTFYEQLRLKTKKDKYKIKRIYATVLKLHSLKKVPCQQIRYSDCKKFGYETAEVSRTHCSWISNKKFGFSKGNLIVWNFLAGKDFLHSFYSITLPEGPCGICKHLVAVQKLRVHLTERVTSTLHTNVLHQPIKVRLVHVVWWKITIQTNIIFSW